MKNEIECSFCRPRTSGIFSKEEGLEIQFEQIEIWKGKLNAEIFADLLERKEAENATLNENSCGHDVWRGTSIDEFIGNWEVKYPKFESKINSIS